MREMMRKQEQRRERLQREGERFGRREIKKNCNKTSHGLERMSAGRVRLNKVKFDRTICPGGISRGQKWGLKRQGGGSQSEGFHRTERRAPTRPNEDWWPAAAADRHRKGSLSMREEAKKPFYTDT